MVVGGNRLQLTLTVECGAWERVMSEINSSGKMSELGRVPDRRRDEQGLV